jgi:hypothetical protein
VLTKYDQAGQEVWARPIEPGEYTTVTGLAVGADGSVALVAGLGSWLE